MKKNGFLLPMTLFLLLLLLITFEGTIKLFELQYKTEKMIQKQYQAKSYLRLGLENHTKKLQAGTEKFIVYYSKNRITCQLIKTSESHYTFQAIVQLPNNENRTLLFYWDKHKREIQF